MPYRGADGRTYVGLADPRDPDTWALSIKFNIAGPYTGYIVTHRASGFQMQAVTIAEAKRQIRTLLALPQRYHPSIRRLLDAEQYAQALELARSLTGVG